MKGIILEKRDGFAAVLREDGTIEKLKTAGEVGERITLPKKNVLSYGSVKAAVAAAVVLVVSVLGGGYHHYLYGEPVSYVTLETDRAIELSVNRSNEVISVAAIDNDAKDVVSAYKDRLNGRTSMDVAVETAVEILYEKSASNETLSLNVASDDSSRQVEIVEVSQTAAAKAQADYAEVTLIRTTVASSTDRETAKNLGISTAKLIEQQEDDTKTPAGNTAQPAADAAAAQAQNADASAGKSTAAGSTQGGTPAKDAQGASAPAVTTPAGTAGTAGSTGGTSGKTDGATGKADASGKTDASTGASGKTDSTTGKTDTSSGTGKTDTASGTGKTDTSGTSGSAGASDPSSSGTANGHTGTAGSDTSKDPAADDPKDQETPADTGEPPAEAPAPSTDVPPLEDTSSDNAAPQDVTTPPLQSQAEDAE